MNRRENRSLPPVTHVTACALILATLSGCSLFSSTSSLSSLMPTDGVTAASTESDEQSISADETSFSEVLSDLDDSFDNGAMRPSAPSGRLLSPEFGQPAPTPDDSSGGHSLVTSIGQSAESLAPTIIRPVSQTRELFEDPDEQSVAQDPRSVQQMEQTVNTMTVATPEIRTVPEAQAGVAQISAHSPVVTELPQPEPVQESVQPAPTAEPSMFDRLRGFAPDRRTGDLLRRGIERIPNPLNLLPGRDEETEPVPPPQSPTATAELRPLPEPAPVDFATADTSELLSALIDTLERELETWPQTETGSALQPDEYRRRQLNLRLLRLIDDQPAAAAEAIDLMPPEEQEFWQELILGISQFRNPEGNVDYRDHIADTIGQLNLAVRRLEPLSHLSIRRLDFCTSIEGFGTIQTFPTNTFEPGQRVMIYAEVDNLQSEVSPLRDTYRTSFSGVLQIWPDSDDAEEPVNSFELETVHDDSSTRRIDYYLSYEITLPVNLPPGGYEIRLKLHDDIGGRDAHSRLKFSIH